ncbi:MAG: hypothetical protein ABJB12_24565 [Pseudomonadota bacterium]
MKMPAQSLPVMLTMLAAAGRAHAQEAAADALFDSARAAMAKGDFERACEQFKASDKLDPASGTELNLADCEEKRGRLAGAWELFRTVEEKLSANDERLPVAHARAQALQGRVPRLTVRLAPGAPPSSTFREGGVEFDAATFGLPLPMDPGAHELLVSAPGFVPRLFSLRLAEGESRELTVLPGAPLKQVQPAAVPLPSSTPRESSSGRAGTRTLGFALGGVGIGGVSVGAVAGVLMLGQKNAVNDECHPDKSCTKAGLAAAHSAHTLQAVSNVGWVVGAAALGAGAYLLLTSNTRDKPSTTLALAPTPTGGQLSLNRSW